MSSAVLSTILYLIAVISYVNGYRSDIRPRVIEGVNDTHNEFPYVVSLQMILNSEPVKACTGSLITETWIITAAHCFQGPLSLVRYGDMTLHWSKTTSYSKILKKIPHPSFMELPVKGKIGIEQRKFRRNDIALVLSEKIPIEQHGRLSAVDYQTLMGLAVRIAGFGLTFDLDKIDNKEALVVQYKKWLMTPLQLGVAAVVPCTEVFNKVLVGNSGPFICVAPPCAQMKHETQGGDSGGPLFLGNKIVGVLVGGVNPISGYTPVSLYLTWIHDVISKNHA